MQLNSLVVFKLIWLVCQFNQTHHVDVDRAVHRNFVLR